MMEALLSKPWTVIKYARVLAELQANIHMVEEVMDLPSQHERLRRKIQVAEKLSPDLRECALEFLEELPEDEIEWLGGKASKEKSTQDKGKAHLDGLKALLG